MNTKGGLGTTIKIGIGLVLGILLLLFSLTVGTTFLGIFFQDPSELTENSMDNLEFSINSLSFCEGDSILFTMSKGYYVVSFDNSTLEKSGSQGYYERPANECYGSACLMVCAASDEINACKSSKIVKSFDYIDKFDIKSPGNSAAGIISYTENEMINLYIARKNGTLIFKEMVNAETIDSLNAIYLQNCN